MVVFHRCEVNPEKKKNKYLHQLILKNFFRQTHRVIHRFSKAKVVLGPKWSKPYKSTRTDAQILENSRKNPGNPRKKLPGTPFLVYFKYALPLHTVWTPPKQPRPFASMVHGTSLNFKSLSGAGPKTPKRSHQKTRCFLLFVLVLVLYFFCGPGNK